MEFWGSSHLDWNPAAGETAQGSCRIDGRRGSPLLSLHRAGRSGAPGPGCFCMGFGHLESQPLLQALLAARPPLSSTGARPVLSGANTRCLVEPLFSIRVEAPGEAKGEWREASGRASHASELGPRAGDKEPLHQSQGHSGPHSREAALVCAVRRSAVAGFTSQLQKLSSPGWLLLWKSGSPF